MTTLYITELLELASADDTSNVPIATLPPDKPSTLANTVAPVGAPVQTAPSTANSGGTIPNNTYFLKITATTASGESVASNEQSITTAGTNISTITANWGLVTGATGYKVYIGTAAGAENLVATVGNVATTTLTALPGTAGSPPTTTNTAAFITLKPTTRFVMVSTDSVCSIKVGPNADCAQTDTRLAANERVIFRVDQPVVLPAQAGVNSAVGYSNAASVGNTQLQAQQFTGLKLSTVLNT